MMRALWIRACVRECQRVGMSSGDAFNAATRRRHDDLVFFALLIIGGVLERCEWRAQR